MTLLPTLWSTNICPENDPVCLKFCCKACPKVENARPYYSFLLSFTPWFPIQRRIHVKHSSLPTRNPKQSYISDFGFNCFSQRFTFLPKRGRELEMMPQLFSKWFIYILPCLKIAEKLPAYVRPIRF